MSAASVEGGTDGEPGRAAEGAGAADSAAGRESGGPAPSGSGTGADDRITVRLVMPDRWLEHVAELPASMTVEDAKRVGLREMLQRDTDDPVDFYVEYAERQVPDESATLEELGVQPREILSIRAYDLGHYPRFEG